MQNERELRPEAKKNPVTLEDGVWQEYEASQQAESGFQGRYIIKTERFDVPWYLLYTVSNALELYVRVIRDTSRTLTLENIQDQPLQPESLVKIGTDVTLLVEKNDNSDTLKQYLKYTPAPRRP